MKNFYEATVTKPSLYLKMALELDAVGICPCQIKINDHFEFYGDLVGKNIFIRRLPLTESIEVQITVDRQHPQAVNVVSLKIDNYEILPNYQHLANPPTNYIDFNSVWTLKIPNFYPWLHDVTGQGWVA